jgi:hypothetical protein
MSEREQPGHEPEALDEAHEVALMREVMREQEEHREGGVEPGLDDGDAAAGPGG